MLPLCRRMSNLQPRRQHSPKRTPGTMQASRAPLPAASHATYVPIASPSCEIDLADHRQTGISAGLGGGDRPAMTVAELLQPGCLVLGQVPSVLRQGVCRRRSATLCVAATWRSRNQERVSRGVAKTQRDAEHTGLRIVPEGLIRRSASRSCGTRGNWAPRVPSPNWSSCRRRSRRGRSWRASEFPAEAARFAAA